MFLIVRSLSYIKFMSVLLLLATQVIFKKPSFPCASLKWYRGPSFVSRMSEVCCRIHLSFHARCHIPWDQEASERVTTCRNDNDKTNKEKSQNIGTVRRTIQKKTNLDHKEWWCTVFPPLKTIWRKRCVRQWSQKVIRKQLEVVPCTTNRKTKSISPLLLKYKFFILVWNYPWDRVLNDLVRSLYPWIYGLL